MGKSIQVKARHVRIIDGKLFYRFKSGSMMQVSEGTNIKYLLTRKSISSIVRLARQAMQSREHDGNDSQKYLLNLKIAERSRGNHYLNKQVEKHRRTLEEDKRPESLKTHIGVEVEFVSESSKRDIIDAFARAGLGRHVTYHSDGSVQGEGGSGECSGDCRDNCECYYCGETHYCEGERECARRSRNNGDGASWEFKEDCEDCTDTEILEDCDCGGTDAEGAKVCKGEHIVCSGHCSGHPCNGSEDHDDWDCNCECDCGNGETGHEICIIAERTQIYKVMERVCSILNDRLSASVNKTCGLHVHLDVRRRGKAKVYGRLLQALPFLAAIVPDSRLRNTYCQLNKESFETTVSGGTRYWAINPQSVREHGTIEVRLHSGTTDPIKINNWIRLLQFLAYDRKSTVPVNSFTQLLKQGLPIDTVFYLHGRYKKFGEKRADGWKPVNEDMSQAVGSLNEAASEAA